MQGEKCIQRIEVMKHISIAQLKFISEFLGNFSLVWIAGSFVSPFLTHQTYNINFIIGILVGLITFWAGIILLRGVKY